MTKDFLPIARKNNLVIQELFDELLIYDLRRNKALCLNQTAKLILEQCDGKTTFREAAENIKRKTKAEINDEIFWVALEKFKTQRLLDESQPIPNIPKVSRRDLMQSGLALSVVLPLITALSAPSPVQAQSGNGACIAAGGICSLDINAMDNCCIQTSCTMTVNGFCCIINQQACDSNNDLCCPGTICDSNTDTCQTIIP